MAPGIAMGKFPDGIQGLEVQADDPHGGIDGLHPGNARLGNGVALMRLALAGIFANGSCRSQNHQVKRWS